MVVVVTGGLPGSVIEVFQGRQNDRDGGAWPLGVSATGRGPSQAGAQRTTLLSRVLVGGRPLHDCRTEPRPLLSSLRLSMALPVNPRSTPLPFAPRSLPGLRRVLGVRHHLPHILRGAAGKAGTNIRS